MGCIELKAGRIFTQRRTINYSIKILYPLSETSYRARHHIDALEICQIIFSAYDGNENRDTGHLVKHSLLKIYRPPLDKETMMLVLVEIFLLKWVLKWNYPGRNTSNLVPHEVTKLCKCNFVDGSIYQPRVKTSTRAWGLCVADLEETVGRKSQRLLN
jgi:hypothetical protein